MAFFDDNLIVHTHIPKTAGSSFTRGFIRAFGKGHVYDIRSRQKQRPETMTEAVKDDIHVLTGHFRFGTHDASFERTKLYVACVRPPFDRFRSSYYFVTARPNHPGNRRYEGRDLARAVEASLEPGDSKTNIMSRILANRKEPALQEVLDQAERAYLLVTPHDRVNDTIARLAALAGGRVPRKEFRKNVGDKPKDEVGDALRQRFDEVNALDVALYRFVCERYEGWLGSLEARLDDLRNRDPLQR
jgi:sulfotransferase famil protein